MKRPTNHPKFGLLYSDWQKYRLTMEGGRAFVDKYLKKFSTRESNADFNLRRQIAHCSAHAKAALVDLKATIYNRLPEVSREGGEKSYVDAISGLGGGVDGSGATMDAFIGQNVLMELLGMGKIGVVVDRKPLPEGFSKADSMANPPYLYTVQAESILNWRYDKNKELMAVYFSAEVENLDESGLVDSVETVYHHYLKVPEGVDHTVFRVKGKKTTQETELLKISKVPVIILELSQSLLVDVCEIQMALTNMHSSDIVYAQEANYPFYTEQYAPGREYLNRVATGEEPEEDGEAANATQAKEAGITLGATKGRRYPANLERPAYIHPSPEPLKVSMEKEEQLKAEIRQLLNLGLANLVPLRASSDSKQKDKEGVEAGVVVIAQELQRAEGLIAAYWHDYLGEKSSVKIVYPSEFSVKSETERVKESDDLINLAEKIVSTEFKKEIHIIAARNMLRTKLTQEDMERVIKGIRNSELLLPPKDLIEAVHEGMVSAEFASKLMGFPEGETTKAQKEHADRLARIAIHQQKGAGARGVVDEGDTDDGDREKREQK